MRFMFTLVSAMVILSSLASSSPTPTYEQGDIVRARPKHWGDDNKKAGKHFGVVVGKNPSNNKYKIAHTSHNLPQDRYPHQDDAIHYHVGLGDTRINTGKPVEVAEQHLQPASPSQGWHKMEDEKLATLKSQINRNCPEAGLRRRDARCKPEGKVAEATTDGQNPLTAPNAMKSKQGPALEAAKKVGEAQMAGNGKLASRSGFH